ncbi:MAG TPA: hypothetical protein VHU19_14225 [Pyrinomonadaceae bacterium]|jgi:hypothetical protein|nr:hypothetical protein [Pyrinomonadaceae bacterium]
MPATTLSTDDQAKLDALTALIAAARAAGPQVQVVELVAATWPAPDGLVYYASTFADDTWPSLKAKLAGTTLEPRLNGGQFLDLTRDSGISDDSVSLDLWDADHKISDLFETHGEGVRIEIFFYFPQVDLLLSMWFGHLRPPTDADEERFTASAENGFMSVLLPLPRRAFFNTCQAVFGALLSSQAEIDEHDCPYNRHLGGATGLLDPATGLPFTSCPRNTRQACIDRLGDSLSYLSFDTVIQSYSVQATHGSTIATSRGNETNLKRPLRVIAGKRVVRDLDLLEYVVEIGNPDHPERGSIKLLYAVAEGRNRSLTSPKANNTAIQPQHFSVRVGAKRQSSTGFTTNVNNYSSTALLNAVLQGDFSKVDPSQISTEITVEGLDDVRVYASEDPTDFVEQYSQDRAWWLLHAYRHKRWGLGSDVRRFFLQDFRDLSTWFADSVSYHNPDGTVTTAPRSTFNAELIDRTAQQQINDICLAGRCTVPFPFEGKLRVFPLKKLTTDELAAAPVFTDYDSGYPRNIIRDEQTGKSTLTRSATSDAELPNSIVVTYNDAAQDYKEIPLPPIDSIDQQLRAGRAFGDTGRRAVEKRYGLLGVTTPGEAARVGVLIRDLGEFDEGGIENNQRIKFQTFFTQGLGLYKSKVIRVLSRSLINTRTGVQRFEHFRVRSTRQLPNLLVEVSAQAYPVAYYATTEDLTAPVAPAVPDPLFNPGGDPGDRPRPVIFPRIDVTADQIIVEMARS